MKEGRTKNTERRKPRKDKRHPLMTFFGDLKADQAIRLNEMGGGVWLYDADIVTYCWLKTTKSDKLHSIVHCYGVYRVKY